MRTAMVFVLSVFNPLLLAQETEEHKPTLETVEAFLRPTLDTSVVNIKAREFLFRLDFGDKIKDRPISLSPYIQLLTEEATAALEDTELYILMTNKSSGKFELSFMLGKTALEKDRRCCLRIALRQDALQLIMDLKISIFSTPGQGYQAMAEEVWTVMDQGDLKLVWTKSTPIPFRVQN